MVVWVVRALRAWKVCLPRACSVLSVFVCVSQCAVLPVCVPPPMCVSVWCFPLAHRALRKAHNDLDMAVEFVLMDA